MKVNLALVQMNTVLGDVKRNLEKHLDYVNQARTHKTDLVLFPELSLTGYVLQDLASAVAIRPVESDPVFSRLLSESKNIDIIFGFVEEDARSRFHIAAAYLSAGKIVHIHRKIYLPTYGLFDEGRFFAWGNAVNAFDTRFGRVGMLICEDFWHAALPYLLWLDGADLFLFTSASPGRGMPAQEDCADPPRLNSSRWVDDLLRAYAGMFTSYVVHTNRVGFEDGLNFWGGASVFSPDGDLLVQGPQHEETIIYKEIDLNALHRTRARLPLLRDERTALVQRELARILENKSSPH